MTLIRQPTFHKQQHVRSMWASEKLGMKIRRRVISYMQSKWAVFIIIPILSHPSISGIGWYKGDDARWITVTFSHHCSSHLTNFTTHQKHTSPKNAIVSLCQPPKGCFARLECLLLRHHLHLSREISREKERLSHLQAARKPMSWLVVTFPTPIPSSSLFWAYIIIYRPIPPFCI